MFVLVILGVAALTNAVPVEESKESFGLRRRSTPGEDPFRSELESSYGRRRRSPQDDQALPPSDIDSEDDQIAVESTDRVSASNIANILRVAGAKSTPINRQGGYGRKRRSPMDSSSSDFDIVQGLSLTHENGLDSRRKRSPQKVAVPVHSNAHQYGLVEDAGAITQPEGKYGDLQKILALSGAKPQPVSGGVSYGRRKRSDIITNEIQTGPTLVKDVAIHAVKIKSHGNYGKIAQVNDAGATSKHVVLNGRSGRRKRSDNFIPFNVYDERRVKTLKIEQNDALALPMRLQIEHDNSDRTVKKRHFTPNQ